MASTIKGAALSANPIHMCVTPVADTETETAGGMTRREADLGFALDQELAVGHRGSMSCGA